MSGCDWSSKSFSVYSGTGQQYRDNWDATFGKKRELEGPPSPCRCRRFPYNGGTVDTHGCPLHAAPLVGGTEPDGGNK